MKSTARRQQNGAVIYTAETICPDAARRPQRSTGALPRYKLRQVIEYINNNLARDVTLCEVAQVLGISSHHFAHVFKQTTGVAPHQYLIARRIARAKLLLRETDLPMSEIAHQVGYSNQGPLLHPVSPYVRNDAQNLQAAAIGVSGRRHDKRVRCFATCFDRPQDRKTFRKNAKDKQRWRP